MKQSLVSDGATRLRNTPEQQSRLIKLRQNIQARHAAELAQAGFFQRLKLRWRMAVEYRRERRKLVPSAQALYGCRVAAKV